MTKEDAKYNTPTDTNKKAALKIDIKDINNAKYIGKYVSIVGTISEKERTPFVARTQIQMTCKSNVETAICQSCQYVGKQCHTIKLDVFNAEILYFINAKEKELRSLYKQLSFIPSGCRKSGFSKYTKNQNLYRCGIVPRIDYVNSDKKSVGETVDNMYSIHVAADLFGELDVHENRDYIFSGVPHIDPNDGRLIYLIDQVIPVADDISNFDMTKEKQATLKEFQCDHTVEAIHQKNDEILREHRVNHHKIFGYGRMEYFMHMVFHSVSAFTFVNKSHFRGWLDGAIIGDSRTGKSELLEQKINQLQMGYRASCDNITQAGVMGGMSQSSIKGGQYQLKWGLLPRLDRRLVGFDEAHNPNAILIWPKLNDSRASGTVKVTKVGAPDRSTKARVRKIFIANPPSGLTTNDFYYPVEMLPQIFTTPECIARLDFLYVPRLEDSTYTIGEEDEVVFPNYCEDIDKLLLKFIYSRTVDQVEFTLEAEEYLTEKGQEIAKVSDNIRIPLIQSNEAKFTLARGAAAQAAAVCSVDDKWEKIIVHKAHAEVYVEALINNYSHESNSYFAYSHNANKKIKFENSEEFYRVCTNMRQLFDKRQGLLRFLLEENQFNFKYLVDIFAIDAFEFKKIYSGLIRYNLINAKATNSSFNKTRRGIVIFKYLLQLESWARISENHCKDWFDNLGS